MGKVVEMRRRYGGGKLPYDAEIEYLESTGTQYIDTGIICSNNSRIKMNVKFALQGGVYAVSGARNYSASIDKAFYVYIVYNEKSNRYYIQFGYNTKAENTLSDNQELFSKVLDVDFNKILANVNDITRHTFNVSVFTTSSTLLLFNCHTGSSGTDIDSRGGKMQLHDCAIWNSDILVRDYIPVRKGTTGYMYDKVSGQLFGNDGTGSFILGADKTY